MTKFSSVSSSYANGEFPSAVMSWKNSSEPLEDLIGSPLTLTKHTNLSTSRDPCWQQSLVDCFESMLTYGESEEATWYDSAGNGPLPVVQDEFVYSEKSLDDGNAPTITNQISVPSILRW